MNLKDIKKRLKGEYKDKYHKLQENHKQTVEDIKEDYEELKEEHELIKQRQRSRSGPNRRSAMQLDPFGLRKPTPSLKSQVSFSPDLMKAGGEPDYRASFPWLFPGYSDERIAPWDFDPIRCRSVGEEMPLTEAATDVAVQSVVKVPWHLVEVDDNIEMQKRAGTNPAKRVSKATSKEGDAELMTELLSEPDPDHDWSDMVEMILSEWFFVGSSNIIKVFEKGTTIPENPRPGKLPMPARLRPSADPITFSKEFDEHGLIKKYWQFAKPMGDSASRSFFRTEPVEFRPEEIIWSDFKKRSWRRYGLPPTLEVLDVLELLDLTIEQERQYFSHGSIPSGLLDFKGWDREEMEDQWNVVEGDVKGKPWKILPFASGEGGEIEWIQFGFNYKELQFLERKKDYRKTVAMAFRIPESALGTKAEDVNRATASAEIDMKNEDTIPYLLKKIERMFNRYLVHPSLGKSYRFEFDPGVTEDQRQSMANRVSGLYESGLLTQNEARQQLGEEEVEGGDQFKPELEPEPEPEPAMFSSDVGKPFGPWDDFDDCVNHTMTEEGYDEETARAVCGSLQEELKDEDGDFIEIKDEPLRETDDWHEFPFGPSDVEEFAEQLQQPLQEFYEELFQDDDFIKAIEDWLTDQSDDDLKKWVNGETEKSIMMLGRIMQGKFVETALIDQMTEIIQAQTAQTIMDSAVKTGNQIGVDIDPGQISERIRERDTAFIREEAARMEDRIKSRVSEGWKEGHSIEEITSDLEEVADISNNYAETIARSELSTSAEEGRLETGRYVNEVLDEEYVKVWSSSGDHRERESHGELDGKWAHMNEQFPMIDEGGNRHLAKHPADRTLPPGLGIQCRCTLTFKPIDEVDDDDYVGVTG